MSSEHNKAIVRRLIDEGINEGNEAVVDELVAPNYVSHSDSMPAVGAEGFKQVLRMFRAAFPDAQFNVERYVADGNFVVTWGAFTGTHEGPLEGIPPTGKSVRVMDVDLMRIENGRVAEGWAHFDQAGLMQQLGLGTPQ